MENDIVEFCNAFNSNGIKKNLFITKKISVCEIKIFELANFSKKFFLFNFLIF